MTDLSCQCLGLKSDTECQSFPDGFDAAGVPSQATGEDGLCDNCRCEHGCCTDHPNWGVMRECGDAKNRQQISR